LEREVGREKGEVGSVWRWASSFSPLASSFSLSSPAPAMEARSWKGEGRSGPRVEAGFLLLASRFFLLAFESRPCYARVKPGRFLWASSCGCWLFPAKAGARRQTAGKPAGAHGGFQALDPGPLQRSSGRAASLLADLPGPTRVWSPAYAGARPGGADAPVFRGVSRRMPSPGVSPGRINIRTPIRPTRRVRQVGRCWSVAAHGVTPRWACRLEPAAGRGAPHPGS